MKKNQTSENVFTLPDLEMYYEIHGEGQPLLLLHGFSGSAADWRQLDLSWSKGFQLIIPDMRGHGKSKNLSSSFGFRQVAEDLFALLDFLKIKTIKGLGCSGGGNTLLHMAIQQPERVESMILVSATSYYPEQAKQFMRNSSHEKLTEDHWKMLRQKHIHGDEQICKLFSYAKEFADSDDMNFTSNDLSKIKAKTLIVQGDRDFLYPVEISVEMYRAIPNASLWVIPEGNHGPIFADFPHFIKVAASFFQ